MGKSLMVTGVGAIIGQGIVKSLKEAGTGLRLVGIDANPFSVGFKWVDIHYTVPRTDDPAWAGCITDICKEENVALIFPGIEQDVKALLRNRSEIITETGALPLLNSPEALNLGFDKWELYDYAVRNNIKVPKTQLVSEVESNQDFVYPLILKPRRGMAGKGLYKIECERELDAQLNVIKKSDYMLQEFVGTDEEEYTVSIFGYHDGRLSPPFALKRKLNYGSTFEAETFESQELTGIVTQIAERLKIVGPTNFQFRKAGDEFFLLEINPRFSSSTSIKSAFGFNESLMAVKSFLLGESPVKLDLKKGRCLRYISDCVTYT